MDTPTSLREQADQWRALAGHHDRGTADALIEAACALEQQAWHLEGAAAPAVAAAAPPRPAAR